VQGPVAQRLEPAAHNGLVAGSSPAGPTKTAAISLEAAGDILIDENGEGRGVRLRKAI
jgi:hypothetical protein